MRICVISPAAITGKEKWGGIHTHTKMVCKLLRKMGHEVTLLASSTAGGSGEKVIDGMKVVFVDESESMVAGKKWLRQAQETFLKVHLEKPFDCIFSEGHSGFWLKKNKATKHLPVFYVVHNPSVNHFYNNWQEVESARTFLSYFFRTIPRILYRIFFWEIPFAHGCEKVISVSAFNMPRLSRYYLLSPKNIELINNWVETDFFFPDNGMRIVFREKLHLRQDEIVFLLVGSLWRPKGFYVAIQAFSEIVRSTPNLKLLICGEGQEKNKLAAMVKNRRLEGEVIFLGEVDREELPGVYNAADIFLIPSLMREGHAYTLIEAMACGLPVIASAKGGNIETVGDAGVLISSSQPGPWAAAMSELAKDHAARRMYAQKAQNRVFELFSEEVAAKKFEGLLCNLQQNKAAQ